MPGILWEIPIHRILVVYTTAFDPDRDLFQRLSLYLVQKKFYQSFQLTKNIEWRVL